MLLARRPRTAFLLAIFAVVSFACTADDVGLGESVAVGTSIATMSTPLVRLEGHLPPWRTTARDLGPLDGATLVTHASVVVKRSPARQAAFEALLDAQQLPGSPDFHRWLTPEALAEQFGPQPAEIDRVARWLNARGLHVDARARGGGWLTFHGTAAAIGAALATEIHAYDVDGERRVSIADEPSIPVEVASIVRSFVGLSSHRLRPMYKDLAKRTGRGSAPSPLYTSGSAHAIAPADFATIYDIAPITVSGIVGTGESIAIVGRSRVDPSDVTAFQTLFGLPLVAPKVVIPTNGNDPGSTHDGDQAEAMLDVTRAGSVATGATIDLVISGATASGILDAIDLDIAYAVDQNLAPIISISFLTCESDAGKSWATYYDALFAQAAAEGVTVLVSSGDSGVAGCENHDAPPPAVPSAPSPNILCSSGNVTCVGGTEFAENGDASYWQTTNGPLLGSAVGYIPEGAWNEPTDDAGGAQLAATGGASSALIAKPTWQIGPGVPADGFRDTPDISFTSSGHDAYLVCLGFLGHDCASGSYAHFYGTSASAPSMAGIVALLDQANGARQGNINPALYRLANGPSAAAVFHDVTVASSGVVDCVTTTASICNNSSAGPSGATGGVVGFPVGVGYDLATGLGSLDVAQLLTVISCGGALDGSPCDDFNACTQGDSCSHGTCLGHDAIVCTPLDDCHIAGVCDPVTAKCTAPVAQDGTACDDHDGCTQIDLCVAGLCHGSDLKSCYAMDACHGVGSCDPTSGHCSNPVSPDGTACDDGNACTRGDGCASGACIGGAQVVCASASACQTASICEPTTGKCEGATSVTGEGCDAGVPIQEVDAGDGGSPAPASSTSDDPGYAKGPPAPAGGACGCRLVGAANDGARAAQMMEAMVVSLAFLRRRRRAHHRRSAR